METGEIAQQLRTIVLVDDPELVLSTHVAVDNHQNCSSRRFNALAVDVSPL